MSVYCVTNNVKKKFENCKFKSIEQTICQNLTYLIYSTNNFLESKLWLVLEIKITESFDCFDKLGVYGFIVESVQMLSVYNVA